MFFAWGCPQPGFLRRIAGLPRSRPGLRLSKMPTPDPVGRLRKVSIWLARLAALCLSLPGIAAAADGELHFGVFPNMSARVMVDTYQPLADYLGGALERPVNLESATDFITFHQRTLDHEYGLLLTAPHLAWLAWKEGGYRPVLTYREPVKGLIVVRSDGPCRKIQDLKGKTIAMPDPLAVVTIRMEKILGKAGLRFGRELTAIEAGSHTNAATLVVQGQADSAVVGKLPFMRLPKELKDRLRPIAETPALTSQVYLVHPRTTAAEERLIVRSIEEFARSEAGRTFLQKGNFGGVRPLGKNELQEMEGDAREFNRRLKAQAPATGKAP